MGKTFNTGRLGNGLFVDANGNVGINTTSPGYDASGYGAIKYFTQYNAGGVSYELSANSTANDAYIGSIDFINTANTGASGAGRYGIAEIRAYTTNASATTTGGGYLMFVTKADGSNQAERMRITSSGNVGIGTSSPNSALNIVNNASTNGLTIKSAGNGGTFPLRVTWSGGSDGDMLSINDSGNVQINNALSTYAKINVKQTNNQIYSGLAVYSTDGTETFIGIGNIGSAVGFEATYGSTGSYVPMIFKTGGTEKMRIGTDGTISIGAYHSNAKILPGSDSNHYLRYLTSLDGIEIGGYSGVMFSTYGGNERMRIALNGNVGINTSNPYYTLDVSGSVRAGRVVYQWYWGSWQGNSTYWHMKTNLWGGGSPNGNSQYTMSFFKGYSYSYGGSILEGAVGFHNWSGIIYSAKYTGNIFSNVYVSSDGYVVLVIPSGSGETGVVIDWHQHFEYPTRVCQVTAAGLHGATSGKY